MLNCFKVTNCLFIQLETDKSFSYFSVSTSLYFTYTCTHTGSKPYN